MNIKRLLTGVVATAVMAACISIPASAAVGKDVVETFESYGSNTGGVWKAEPVAESNGAISLKIETKASAPNRGKGEAKGNYRSLRVDYDLTKNEGWSYLRGAAENPLPFNEMIKIDGNGKMSFYAKADKPTAVRVNLNIKDIPFGVVVNLTTEWKKYEYDLRSLKDSRDANVALKEDFITITKQQKWPSSSGKQEAYMVGYKIDFDAALKGTAQAGSVWFDSFELSGDGITETPGDYDQQGRPPAGFVPDKETPSTGGGSSSSSTSSSNNGASSSTPDQNSSTEESSSSEGTSSESTEESSSPSDESSSDVSDAGSSSSESSSSSSEADADASEGSSSAWIVWVIVAVVVLGGAGAAFYFLYWKKK